MTTDCFQAAHKISMKHPHNQKQKRGNDSSQRLKPTALTDGTGERGRHSTSLTYHPIWPRFRHTSERLDHTTQLGFHPPHFLPICQLTCQALLIPPKTLQLASSLLIHVVFPTVSAAADSSTSCTLTTQSSSFVPLFHSPVEASPLLFLVESDVFQLQRARDEADFTALFHQTADPPVIVELLQIGEIRKQQGFTLLCEMESWLEKPEIILHNLSLKICVFS